MKKFHGRRVPYKDEITHLLLHTLKQKKLTPLYIPCPEGRRQRRRDSICPLDHLWQLHLRHHHRPLLLLQDRSRATPSLRPYLPAEPPSPRPLPSSSARAGSDPGVPAAGAAVSTSGSSRRCSRCSPCPPPRRLWLWWPRVPVGPRSRSACEETHLRRRRLFPLSAEARCSSLPPSFSSSDPPSPLPTPA